MLYQQGLTDWRVYSAEHAVGEDEPIDIAHAQQLIADAAAAQWWQAWFPHATAIEVVEGGAEHPEQEGRISSFSYPNRRAQPDKWIISLHPKMLSTRVVLHELAHCLAPSLYSDGQSYACGTPYPPTEHRHHGPYFTATLQVITDQLFAHRDAGELAGALRHFEAPTAELEDLRAELARQPALHAELKELQDHSRRMDEENRAAAVERGEEPPELWIPPWHWGFHLMMRRRDYHRSAGGRLLSQKRFAEIISAVHPCAGWHISELEHSRSRPEDPAQLKRAMAATIYLGFDPIWTRFILGLTRWDCGDITMDEARTLNSAWADLVDHMNELQRQMPPRWYVDGAR